MKTKASGNIVYTCIYVSTVGTVFLPPSMERCACSLKLVKALLFGTLWLALFFMYVNRLSIDALSMSSVYLSCLQSRH